jgi:hypothetical protein
MPTSHDTEPRDPALIFAIGAYSQRLSARIVAADLAAIAAGFRRLTPKSRGEVLASIRLARENLQRVERLLADDDE